MQTQTQAAPETQAVPPVTFDSITLEDGRVINAQSTTAPLWALVPGKNPRVFFDEMEMAELEASVAAQGVIQPIIVRVNEEGRLEIVAGERRYRAASNVKGEDYEMPISFKEYDRNQADAAALIENHHRANVTPAEEAVYAAKILSRFNGERDETAKYLGWARTTLDNRLGLLALSANVTTALNERKITLGTAELLATISRERQEEALPIILEKKLAVADIKAFILSQSKQMATAIFDKAECASCQYNTDLQSSLFGENLGTGSCSNGPCYEQKTEAELESRKKALEDEYPVVKFVRPGDNFTVVRIAAEGKNAVGAEQALACKGCANYGGAISTMPDSLGQAFKGQCFDVKCNKLKVEAYAKSLLPPPEASNAPQAGGNGATPATSSAAKPTEDGKASVQVKAPVTSVADSPRVKEYREEIWREALKSDLQTRPEQSLSLLFALAATGNISNVQREKVSAAISRCSGKKEGALPSVSLVAKTTDGFEKTMREGLLNGLTLSAVNAVEVRHLTDMMAYIEVDLAKHWKINADFLKLLTKSEIEVVAHDIGLKQHLDKTFASLMSKSKDDFIKALLTCGFCFEGIVPKVMQYGK